MIVEISAKIFGGIIGASMGLFETGFRIFIFATVLSESAIDLVHLISQTEVWLRPVTVKMSFAHVFTIQTGLRSGVRAQ